VGDTNQCVAEARALDERNRRFQQMALPHLDAAYNLARWLCGNANDADDVVQEAYLRAFRFFDTFRGDSMRPWLFAIVRRTWYTEWRRRASSEEVAEFDDTQDDTPLDGWAGGGVDPETLAIQAQDAQRVHAALEQLPVEYREVLVLRELEELSYREIATIASVPVGTVMSRLARGRRKLAGVLAAMERKGASSVAGNVTGSGSTPVRPVDRSAASGNSDRDTSNTTALPPHLIAGGATFNQSARETPDEL
jgi:RNA polymerase sigma factor (sigma-70 family)